MAQTPKALSSLSSFAPFAAKLAELAAAHPEAAEYVVVVMTKALERGLRQPTNLNAWARAFEASARQFANRKFAEQWTKAVVSRTRSVAEKFRKTKGDVERAR